MSDCLSTYLDRFFKLCPPADWDLDIPRVLILHVEDDYDPSFFYDRISDADADLRSIYYVK
jgi:hypothetical protein